MKKLAVILILLLAPMPVWAAAAAIPDAFHDESLDFLDEEEAEEQPAPSVPDPLEGWNRAMFEFNDRLYFWVLKPVAQGYKAVVPETVRVGVKNFFTNLGGPGRIVNCFLQGKMEDMANEMAGFLYNSTFGILGLMDLAKNNPELKTPSEDMGQTLAVYGIDDGFFIIWPVLGPSTLRDTVGMVSDGFLYPMYYVYDWEVRAGGKALEVVNATSFRIGDYESLKESAIEPYLSFKNFYLQYRQKRIQDQR